MQAGLQVLEDSNTQLWWAGKDMTPGKKLADFVGKNEKTKIIAKLQKKGQGPPAREAVISEEEKKAMMAYAYRKQEEHKARSKHTHHHHACFTVVSCRNWKQILKTAISMLTGLTLNHLKRSSLVLRMSHGDQSSNPLNYYIQIFQLKKQKYII